MIRWLTLCAVAGLLMLSLGAPRPAAADGPLALAFYYAWFDENSWTPDRVPDMPTPRYASRDRGTIERHVDQAKSASLDALVQSWWGPNNPTDDNLRTLLDVSRAKGFRAAVDFELTSPFYGGNRAAIVNGLRYLIQTHTGHPAYLRWNGKPVIFFWRQNMLSVADWSAIRREVDPNHSTLWIAEGTDTGFLVEFDGHHLYSVAWDANPARPLARYGNEVRSASQRWGDKVWVATVMPGYDDTKLTERGGSAFRRDRANGQYLRASFDGAAASGANWIILTSFNEWPEGTYIEPSEQYGDFYLKLTGDLVRAWKSGSPPPAAAVPAPPPAAADPGGLGGVLLQQGQAKQVIQFNPGAALQKRVFADRFVPNSSEFGLTFEGVSYTAQRAENLGNGAVRVYYVPVGDWGNVRFVERGAAGGLAGALLAEGERKQVIQFNPGAALQKRVFADGFVPNSSEFTVDQGGASYAAQRAENLANGAVRVYYVRVGDWGNVQVVNR